jgi:endonuclease/exonuclease/phosphatase family metal-dependent hydrolase
MLREIDADIIALQEVLRVAGKREEDQAEFIAEAVGMAFCMGENRRLDGGAYGNLILSRHSLRAACNHDISTRGREPRGCMRVDVEVPAIGILTFSIFTWARATWNGVSRLGCS